MRLEGAMPTKCPPGKVVEGLSDPQTLTLLAPAGCTVGQKVGDTTSFVVERHYGPIHFKLPGTITVTKSPDGETYAVEVKASHLIGGSANVALQLTPRRNAAGQQSLHWAGVLESRGLARRLINERTAKVGIGLKNLFLKLRSEVEESL